MTNAWHYEVKVLCRHFAPYAHLNGNVIYRGNAANRNACVVAVNAIPYPKFVVRIWYNPNYTITDRYLQLERPTYAH